MCNIKEKEGIDGNDVLEMAKRLYLDDVTFRRKLDIFIKEYHICKIYGSKFIFNK